MSVTEMALGFVVGGGVPATVAYSGAWLMGQKRKLAAKKKAKAVDASKVDGRTHEEWYAIIKGLGKEEYEKLARPALDGLEEKPEYGWNVQRILGDFYYMELLREWYPDQYEQQAYVKLEAHKKKRAGCKAPHDFCMCDYCMRTGEFGWKPVAKRSQPDRHPLHCLCADCASVVLGSKITPGKGRSQLGRPGPRPRPQNKIPAPPPRGPGAGTYKTSSARVPSARPLGRGVDVTHIQFQDGSGRSDCYRITYGDKSWIANRDDIGRFQTRKGLQPTGVMDPSTRNALNSYLLAGNPWPVEMPEMPIHKPKAELDRIHRELQKWTIG